MNFNEGQRVRLIKTNPGSCSCRQGLGSTGEIGGVVGPQYSDTHYIVIRDKNADRIVCPHEMELEK